jgi:hypothetical protein
MGAVTRWAWTAPSTAQPQDALAAARERQREAAQALRDATEHFDPGWCSIGAADPRRRAYDAALEAKERADYEVERLTPRPVPPSLADHRAALAAAVEKRKAAKIELEAARTAKAASEQAVAQARRGVAETEAGIERARAAAVQHATALATGTAGDPPMSLDQARAMAAAAREHLAIVQDADRALEVRLKRATDGLHLARRAFNFGREQPCDRSPSPTRKSSRSRPRGYQVPARLRSAYLERLVALLPPDHGGADVHRAAVTAQREMLQANGAKPAPAPSSEWDQMWSPKFDYSASDRTIQTYRRRD